MTPLSRGIISSGKLDAGGGGILATNTSLFNGSNHSFSTPDNSAFTVSSFTLEVWQKTASSSLQTVVRQRPLGSVGAGIPGISLELISNLISTSTFVEDGAGNFVRLDVNQVTITSGVWYQLVMTFESNTLKIYKDGSDQSVTTSSSGTVGTIDSTATFYTGQIEAARHFNGQLGFVRFWKNRVLTSGEVTTLYNGGNVLAESLFAANSLDTDLVYAPRLANWSGTAGDELVDQSSSGLVTTNNNSVTFTGTDLDVET
ncbi:MAG: LamG-like jellyroll fold domain-containing protein [Thiotrichaceae bacterium]